MKKRIFAIFSLMLTLTLCFSFFSCGTDDSAANAENEYVGKLTNADMDNGGQTVITGSVNRKIVYTVELEIESEDVGGIYKSLSEKAVALGGYIETDRQYYKDGKTSNCNVTYRIPTEKLNEFLAVAESGGKLTDKYVNTDDITTQYVSAQAKKQALVERKAQYEALLGENITVSEKMSLIEQISSVNSQIMQIDLLLSGYDSDVDYSTVSVEISECGIDTVIIMLIIFGGVAVIGGIVAVIIVVRIKKRKVVKI